MKIKDLAINMLRLFKDPFKILNFSALCVSIAMTPWWNSDSLIIPKLMILFGSSSYLIIVTFSIVRRVEFTRFIKLLTLTIALILIQLLIVIISTDAPLEQQIYGRTGRGLGLLTQISLLVILVVAYYFVSKSNLNIVLIFLIVAVLVSTFYSLMQRFNLDFYDWTTRTNGIIGTLGNPNFQASFAAMALVPAMIYFGFKGRNKFYSLLLLLPLISVIYFAQSTQGYVSGLISILVLLLIYFWYKNKNLFKIIFLFSIVSFFILVQGILGKGFLATLLYKRSIQSRGEMLRNSFSIAKDNPFVGVGLDSLGDRYLMYKDQRTIKGVNEFTDHAHNSLVNNAATGGFPLAILHLFLIILTLYAALRIILTLRSFDKNVTAIICAWVTYLAQSMISPETITLLTWNSIFMGVICGLYVNRFTILLAERKVDKKINPLAKPFAVFMLFISVLITYPYFNVDKMQQDSAELGNVQLAMKSATSFPEATIRYSRIGNALLDSNLPAQALEVARFAVEFNPNAPSAWGLILVNNLATKDERELALIQLKRLDPYNPDLSKIIIPD